MDSYLAAAVWSLLPTVGVLIVGALIFRGITRFDRNERKAYAKIEAEERARRGLAPQQSSSEN